ncbi:MAG: ATP-binding protein [Thermoanaerobaculia bacterium]
MRDEELTDALKDLESDRVERKASLSDKAGICQAICAFANDLPGNRQVGVCFLGVDDNGRCSQLPVTDQLLRTLADLRSDGNLLPFPTLSVQKKSLDGCELAVVLVEPSDAPPVRYRGRVYVRVGPSTRLATPEEERRLSEKHRAGDLPFDVRPALSASLDDLDLDLFRREYLPASLPGDVLAENRRTPEQQMASLRLATIGPDVRPTVLGLLVLGKEPRQYIPGAYVQFLRIEGRELTDPIKDQKEIDGPLLDLLRRLDEILQVHISVATDLTSSHVEIRQPDYPIVALQQLVRNAVLHRSYEGTNAPVRLTWFQDRIEIQNPGGPYGQVTRENFGRPGVTDYRNPHLAEAMKNLGYVQRFGVGIQLARRELEKNGNPPLEFFVEGSHVLAIVRVRT